MSSGFQPNDPNLPSFDAAIAAHFLNQIYKNHTACLVLNYREGAAIPPGPPDRFDAILSRVRTERAHLFFQVADLTPDWADPATHAKGRITTAAKVHVATCEFLWLDCDAKKYLGGDPADAAAHYAYQTNQVLKRLNDGLARLGIVPSVKWYSGAGWQALIQLDAPIAPAEAEDLVAKLHVALGFDPSVKNSNRILRVPGSINWKDDNGRVPSACAPCEILGGTVELQYVRQVLSTADDALRQAEEIPHPEIDWNAVRAHDGWLQSAIDLPDNFPQKGKLIVEHKGTLAELNETLTAAGLLQ